MLWITRLLPGRDRALRRLLRALWITALATLLFRHDALAFGFADVSQRAKQLAATPYKKDEGAPLPKELQGLTYDRYRDIRYKPNELWWRGAKVPFELAFFHQGFYFDQAVRINEVLAGRVREIKFSPELFDYGANKIDREKMQGLGFAGFRVHYPVNTPKYKDEVLVFLGASYFRAIGKGQVYGLSARALAIDTALISGEEFPRFVEFWIEQPAANARELTIYGLLDSKRVTGAYRFLLKPGAETVVDVKAQIFLRENVSKLGLAPLSSMFAFGENQRSGTEDYRPEVHDSDGLLIQSGTGEWIWRPLTNPKRLLVTSFALDQSAGLRADAARPRFQPVRRPRVSLRAPAERLGRAEGQVGSGPGRTGADSIARRNQRQHRRLLGARYRAGVPQAFRLRVPHPVAEGCRDASTARVGDADAPRPRLHPQSGPEHRFRRRFRGAGAAQAADGCALGRR